jgi:hypothetical protein
VARPVQAVPVAVGGMLWAVLDHFVWRLVPVSPLRQKKVCMEGGEISMHLRQAHGQVQEGKDYHKSTKLITKYKKEKSYHQQTCYWWTHCLPLTTSLKSKKNMSTASNRGLDLNRANSTVSNPTN